VEHHHDVGVVLQRPEVTRLLIATVAHVVRVPDDLQRQRAGDLDGVVGRLVVDEDDVVDPAGGDGAVGPLERLARVVRRHDDDDLARGEVGPRGVGLLGERGHFRAST